MFHVFQDNSYDGLNYVGEFTEEELKRFLGQTGYDRVSPEDLLVIEGLETDLSSLKTE